MRWQPRSPEFDRRSIFLGRATGDLVGVELECSLVDEETGLCAPSHGPVSSAATLRRWAERFGHAIEAPTPEATKLTHRAGGSVSLELGGALEYSGPPAKRIVDAVSSARTTMRELSTAARSLGLAVVTGGLSPFTPLSRIEWVRKPRIDLMRRHFAALGHGGSKGSHVMGLSMAVQTTLDYSGANDLSRKAYAAVGCSPLLAALFVNSPVVDGEITGHLSNRMHFWDAVDPDRCGFQRAVIDAGPDAGEDLVTLLVEQASRVPRLYRGPDDQIGDASADHGDPADASDASDAENWHGHLSQVWPQVRIRDTIELRAFDSPPWEAVGAAAALWTALLYDEESIEESIDVVGRYDSGQLARTSQDVALDGIRATIDGVPVAVVANELLDVAERSLSRRVRTGLEPDSVVDLLSPVRAVARSSRTFADDLRDRWESEFRNAPRSFVDAYRVPPL